MEGGFNAKFSVFVANGYAGIVAEVKLLVFDSYDGLVCTGVVKSHDLFSSA